MQINVTVMIEADIPADIPDGTSPPEGGWPALGIRFVDGIPDEWEVPIGFVRRHSGRTFMRTEGAQVVRRPARPDPLLIKDTLEVAPEHLLEDAGPHQPLQHEFVHLDTISFQVVDEGWVTYEVTHQPDKYVDSDDPTEKVTREHYDSGQTRVDSFYRLRRVVPKKKGRAK